jgi:hypothetical protein
MKLDGFFSVAAFSLALGATLSAQNTTGGGSGQPGFENERKVVLRVRYGYAAQPNPGIYEFGGASTQEEANAQIFGETRYWLSSVATASWAEEEHWPGEEHRTAIFVDSVKRSFRQHGDVGIHYQSYNGKYFTRETENGATFKNPRSFRNGLGLARTTGRQEPPLTLEKDVSLILEIRTFRKPNWRPFTLSILSRDLENGPEILQSQTFGNTIRAHGTGTALRWESGLTGMRRAAFLEGPAGVIRIPTRAACFSRIPHLFGLPCPRLPCRPKASGG